MSWIDAAGQTQSLDYGVPNTNQCAECHGEGAPNTLGGKTRHLDLDFDYGKGPVNQIDHLHQLGFFSETPPPAAQRERLVDPFGNAPLPERARSYLDANCAHCHSKEAAASQSGLLLDWFETGSGSDPGDWGVCKTPNVCRRCQLWSHARYCPRQTGGEHLDLPRCVARAESADAAPRDQVGASGCGGFTVGMGEVPQRSCVSVGTRGARAPAAVVIA